MKLSLTLADSGALPRGWHFEGGQVTFDLWCEGRDRPLQVRADAAAGDRIEAVLLPHRMELYVNGQLMDEEWPTAYVLPENFGDCEVTEYQPCGCSEPQVLGEFRHAEGWRPGGGVYVGDCMPFSHEGRYHVLYLKDRHRHRSKFGLGAHQWEHISTGDFITWQIHPMAVPITKPEEGSICTGSWIAAKGKQVLFYTVRSCDGSPAKIRRSVSRDGYHFEKDEQFSFEIGARYTAASARDPKVILGEDGLYHMFLTTRLAVEKLGCLVHLVSENLDDWTELPEPIYVSPDENEPECPDYFALNGWYYLIFSHYGKGTYLYSDKPFSDWRKPADALIPCRSVPKMALWQDRILFTGFNGENAYAGTMTFMEAVQCENGELRFCRMNETKAVNGSEGTGLRLHTPGFDELWYRQRMMSDPATMSYNAGYDLGFDGYHNDTGCIDFPEEKWRGWYDRFIGREPEKFYAYVVCKEDGAFVGEVVLRQEGAPGRYEMGVVIEACHRGKGYSAEAMRLLMDTAFNKLNAQVVCNDFERSRAAALKLHLNAGFEIVSEDDCVHLELTRERYLKRFG